ncbi:MULTISPECIES: carbon-phosphorus lyase complex subunit PhnI [Lonsdalea]|uniref:Carbon-phosphorus lyase complex subunit PhnI n=2 Tax=Lonsdalea TaxID=1082702 RepID=A0ACD1JGY7_9GAMM|nr:MULTISPECIES: carbon-phosphorus lyase complex subunit PhnI [Lonsdalea]OSN01885.1 carbon-phosphorus lyase complex subunit PhnI [Lonsdalea populi]QPQ23991.1 carbon-phosphorus lyase complex subunit PhnI [Lonsdalea populi]RAT16594.1 carbon-phosphorus lyase complex subunit PhnI [Lonsdalea quercina]RAT16738.1 carbon-phosphorus lyase complex subunit PhnI [Lonsdalea quercina]RAT22763.1 carbon-phosphorus lyase complex subunit PhnI [Lonsdalea populi]
MYVAVKGGEKAIEAAHQLQACRRRGQPHIKELSCEQIDQQLSLAVDRVMTEGNIYDRQLAALAIKQASGDLIEAIFLLRAYRSTLPRWRVSKPLDTSSMRLERRISAIFKDLPGGQLLGPTYDYTHRLLDFKLLAENLPPQPPVAPETEEDPSTSEIVQHAFAFLKQQGLLPPDDDIDEKPDDITMTPPTYPCSRSARLQQLVRGDEGFLLSLGYSTQRGYGRNHPFVGEIRTGFVKVEMYAEEIKMTLDIGEILLTECETINGLIKPSDKAPHFTHGYGLAFGRAERKAIAVALADRALQSAEYKETIQGPAQDEEFVLAHVDNVEASGFVSHLKLPHYVDFQSELELLKQLREEYSSNQEKIHDDKNF